MAGTMTKLIIILPCFNESGAIGATARTVDRLIGHLAGRSLISDDSFALYVDDGSTDSTWPEIQSLAASTPRIRGLRLSRNFGHQSLLWQPACPCRAAIGKQRLSWVGRACQG